MSLVLSLFPGIGLLDMAFEEEGFCVVRGPDLIWGGDVHRFHPVANVFQGVIGGPPCQQFSSLRHWAPYRNSVDSIAPNLIPEYERCIAEAQPEWFVMENVREAPLPVVPGYIVKAVMLNARQLGAETDRSRRFSFGTRTGAALMIETEVFEPMDWKPTVRSSLRRLENPDPMSGPRASIADMCEWQGLPRDFFGKHSTITAMAQRKVLGNGVPLPMGRAIARAVKRALATPSNVGHDGFDATHSDPLKAKRPKSSSGGPTDGGAA